MSLSNTRRTLLLGGAGLAACGAGALGGYWWLNRGVVAGDEARLLGASFESLDGATLPLSQWRGKTLIVNFWATWCGPCREEMPEFVQAQREFADKGLQFVGIAIDRRPAVERFAKELKVNYPVLLADPAWLEAVKTMGNPQGVLPFTLVFSPQSAVMLRRVGKLKYDEIKAIFA
ncbi:MAG: TlpA family protein disulfide reductase [Betaproteobacteria bacterium]|nr:MAG: TlpA family protein disulfide reductase [Betaproteobacteria bacterium]